LAGGRIAPGQAVSRKLTLFGGPKKLASLQTQAVPLNDAIDFGFFSVICVPMLWLMRVFFGQFGNWGLAIILLTILVKLATLPLTFKQYKSMAGMKKIQPEMKKLQEKYKEDKVRMQQELMKLYKDHNVNPLSGCLPMLMMMPIYFALYRTIYSAVELYQADFIFWIRDLSIQDPYYITPLLLGVLMFIQMRLNPSAGDAAQQKIMMNVMPIMFTGMMLFLPSGLVVYILINTLLGIAQQFWMYRKNDTPVGRPAKA
jgi:YidC/Oxa1 family membrane protein insertase